MIACIVPTVVEVQHTGFWMMVIGSCGIALFLIWKGMDAFQDIAARRRRRRVVAALVPEATRLGAAYRAGTDPSALCDMRPGVARVAPARHTIIERLR